METISRDPFPPQSQSTDNLVNRAVPRGIRCFRLPAGRNGGTAVREFSEFRLGKSLSFRVEREPAGFEVKSEACPNSNCDETVGASIVQGFYIARSYT